MNPIGEEPVKLVPPLVPPPPQVAKDTRLMLILTAIGVVLVAVGTFLPYLAPPPGPKGAQSEQQKAWPIPRLVLDDNEQLTEGAQKPDDLEGPSEGSVLEPR